MGVGSLSKSLREGDKKWRRKGALFGAQEMQKWEREHRSDNSEIRVQVILL
jgi:hypothetical protein